MSQGQPVEVRIDKVRVNHETLWSRNDDTIAFQNLNGYGFGGFEGLLATRHYKS
jgi:hypothetical protein